MNSQDSGQPHTPPQSGRLCGGDDSAATGRTRWRLGAPWRAGSIAAAAVLSGALAGCSEKAAPPGETCDLGQGACAVGEMSVRFSPTPVPVMRPFAIAVTGSSAQSARIDFQGVEMDMGFNQATLRREADGTLAGQAMLPVCVSGAMRWRADLYLGDSRTIAARFEFDTAGPAR